VASTSVLSVTAADIRVICDGGELKSTAVIDTLLITLTNAVAACCNNPMGLDNIVVGR
jgi:hypothetical protein